MRSSSIRNVLLLAATVAIALQMGSGVVWANTYSNHAQLPAREERTTKKVASFSGEIFLDGNYNGIRELNEIGIAGADIEIRQVNGEDVRQATSDEEGYYLFSDLPLDEFVITVSPPRGYFVTANGTFAISTGEAQAPFSTATGVSAGVFLPFLASN